MSPTGYILVTSFAPGLASTFGIGGKKTKKAKKTTVDRSAPGGPDDTEEWIKGSNYEAHQKKKAASAVRKSAAK